MKSSVEDRVEDRAGECIHWCFGFIVVCMGCIANQYHEQGLFSLSLSVLFVLFGLVLC